MTNADPNFDKPFEDLTEDEMQALEAHDWSPGQIMRAIRMALDMGDMAAVVSLLGRLAKKDPRSAAAIVAVIEAAA
jgi:hypothetical protein